MKIRDLLSAALLLGPAYAGAAEPIVVPEFSFDSNESFALSVMLHAEVVDRLLADGHIVLSQDVVAREVGEAAIDRCLENPTCPQEILPRIPAQVALLGRISRQGGSLQGHVELWDRSRTTALDVRDIVIKPGLESQFSDEVAQATMALLARVPPSSTETLMAAARMIAGQPAGSFGGGQPAVPAPQPVYVPSPQPGYVPAPQPGYVPGPQPGTGAIQPYIPPTGGIPAPQPVQPQPVYPAPAQPTGGTPGYAPLPAPVAPILDLDDDGRKKPSHRGPTPARAGGAAVDYRERDIASVLEGTGLKPRHVAGAEQSLRNSGMDPRDWLYKAMPHGGRLVVELHGGLGIGDVDRQADVRLALVDGVKVVDWYQEGPISARRLRGGLFVGYAPVAFFDFGVLVGLQYGKRYYSQGYHITTAGQVETPEPIWQEVAAIQFIGQPRLRAYVVPTGPAKPYLFVGGDVRVFDDYQTAPAPPGTPAFPTPVGGVVPGVIGGGGLLIDPSPIVGFFVEGGYIRHFGSRASAAELPTGWSYGKPPPPLGTQSTIVIEGGLQFRL